MIAAIVLVACINQGPDHRLLHWLVCPLQRVSSFHSMKPPLWIVRIGQAPSGFTLPPYVIIQRKDKEQWLLIRFGWRFDTNWPGYIFPTGAIKKINEPLPNGY